MRFTHTIEVDKARPGERGATWSERNDIGFSKRFRGGEKVFRAITYYTTKSGEQMVLTTEPFRQELQAKAYVKHMQESEA